MEDDKIKELFGEFQPDLSSTSRFMATLEKSMEAVEIVKQYNLTLKRRNKLAVAIAAASGFIVGVVLTLLFPLIYGWVSSFDISLPDFKIYSLVIDYGFVVWLLIGGACVMTALNVYEIASAKLAPKGRDVLCQLR